jgi:hypothetical protein
VKSYTSCADADSGENQDNANEECRYMREEETAYRDQTQVSD